MATFSSALNSSKPSISSSLSAILSSILTTHRSPPQQNTKLQQTGNNNKNTRNPLTPTKHKRNYEDQNSTRHTNPRKQNTPQTLEKDRISTKLKTFTTTTTIHISSPQHFILHKPKTNLLKRHSHTHTQARGSSSNFDTRSWKKPNHTSPPLKKSCFVFSTNPKPKLLKSQQTL
jgi:hypothetical protein